jgi:hypothetical protein
MEIETVKGWITRAQEINNVMHLRTFWRILDVLEGYSWARIEEPMIRYVMDNVRQSPQRDAVLMLMAKKLEINLEFAQ